MFAITFDEPGDESVLKWTELPDPVPAPGQVVLDVRATAVNRADLLQRRGFYPPPPGASPLLGLEAAGVVSAVGEGVQGWSIGDEAMALLAGGGYAEKVAVDARLLLPVPRPLTVYEAGAVPEVYLTAYLNLVELGRLKAGERVLIHGGSGGVGTAALQIARVIGAEVWTTAGGPERCARCLTQGADVALDHRADDFVEPLKAKGGADLILDVMGAKYLGKNVDAAARDGRVVVIGLQGGTKAELDLNRLLTKRLTLVGSTLRPRTDDDKAGLVARFRERLFPLLDDGTLRPVIHGRMALRDAAEAHRAMAAGEPFGKLLLVT